MSASTIGAWVATVSTCGHCLADFTGPISAHTCERRLKTPRTLGSGAPLPRKFTGRKATENLANALASSPTYEVKLDLVAIVDLAVCHELAHGRHLTAKGTKRTEAIAQAARDFAAYRGPHLGTRDRQSLRTVTDLRDRARLLLGFGITVERALALAGPEARGARRLVAEEIEMVQRWRASTIQERCK